MNFTILNNSNFTGYVSGKVLRIGNTPSYSTYFSPLEPNKPECSIVGFGPEEWKYNNKIWCLIIGKIMINHSIKPTNVKRIAMEIAFYFNYEKVLGGEFFLHILKQVGDYI